MTPYKVALGSHKGGTGRTTSALALAWHLGRQGYDVTLVDTDLMRAAVRVAMLPQGYCPWPGVTVLGGVPDWDALHGDFVVVDGPALVGDTRHHILPHMDGIILTCLAEVLSIRTLPMATEALRSGSSSHSHPSLVGVLLTSFDESDPLQQWVLQEFRQLHPELLCEPPIPFQTEMAEWPMYPGTDVPHGPSRDGYASLAEVVRNLGSRSAADTFAEGAKSW